MSLTFEEIALPVSITSLAVLLAILRRRKRGWVYCFSCTLFWLYLLALIGLTLFPLPILETPESRRPVAAIMSRVNLIPFDFGGLFDLHPNVIRNELAGNILLTVPFGLAFPFLARVRTRAIPWLAVAVGVAIETSQLFVSLAIGSAYRGVDINDVLLNATGVFIGYGFGRCISWFFQILRLSLFHLLFV